MGKTSIEWTDASWNPIVGCTEISPGCANCYAARLAATRLRETPQYRGLAEIEKHIENTDYGRPRWTGELRFHCERLEEPLHWRAPRKIFVCDMGDLFHEDVTRDEIQQVFDVTRNCPQHTFQILTKRAQRMRDEVREYHLFYELKNVWLGVSVENQHFADERIPLLLQTPAAVRWISAEPLLGPVEIWKSLPIVTGLQIDVDWVVCGGESGPNARPMHPGWARALRDQCVAAGVPFFFKQWGEWAPQGNAGSGLSLPGVERERTFVGHNLGAGQMMLRYGKRLAGRLLDGREWNEFPGVLCK